MKTPLNIIAALRTEELRLSKRELQRELRAQGIRIHLFSLAQLTAEAQRRQAWFAHDAFRNVLQKQLCDLLRRANIKKPKLSSFQIAEAPTPSRGLANYLRILVGVTG
jgi:hypothetical protein